MTILSSYRQIDSDQWHPAVPAGPTSKFFDVVSMTLFVQSQRRIGSIKTTSYTAVCKYHPSRKNFKKFADKRANRLELLADATAKRLLDISRDIRRPEHLKPYDLVRGTLAKIGGYLLVVGTTPNTFVYSFIFTTLAFY